jgi:hypothetical protein
MAINAPILATRIPEGRAVEGLEYGAHYSSRGWTGYHVRPTGSGLPFGVARQTPASDELEESDEATVGEIGTELRRFVRWCEHYGYAPESPEAVQDYQEAGEALAALEAATEKQEGERLTVTMGGPNGEHLEGTVDVDPDEQMNSQALRAAQEAVLEAHDQLDQDTRAEGPEHWEGWTVEVWRGDSLHYKENVPHLLGDLIGGSGMSTKEHLEGLIEEARKSMGQISQPPGDAVERAQEEFESYGFDTEDQAVEKAILLRGNELRDTD